MLQFSVLASGSKGNCILVANDNVRVLIDCGLSGRETAKRLTQLGIQPDTIQAIVVTHEHADHVGGVRVFARRHRTAVYANSGTIAAAGGGFLGIEQQLVQFVSGRAFKIGDLLFEPFSIPHDAADPVGFRITNGTTVLGVATDLGHVTTLVRERIRDAHALILESNHDLEMLRNCSYPWPVKQRIRGTHGHLSNGCAGIFLNEVGAERDNRLEIAIAAHISENSNTPDLALAEFRAAWQLGACPRTIELAAAAAHTATPLYAL